MRVNAGLKSKKELIQRMIDGERFFYNSMNKNYEIYYHESGYYNSPLRVIHSEQNENLNELFEYFKEMEIDKPYHWTDDLKDGPIFFFVSNHVGVYHYNDKFLSCDGLWSYAEPVAPEMLWKPKE